MTEGIQQRLGFFQEIHYTKPEELKFYKAREGTVEAGSAVAFKVRNG